MVLDQKAEEADASPDFDRFATKDTTANSHLLGDHLRCSICRLDQHRPAAGRRLDITGHRPVPLLSIAAVIVVYLLFNRSAQEGSDSVSLSQTGLFRISLLLLSFSLYSWVGKDPGFAAVLFLIMPVVYALSGPFARSKSGGSLLPLGLSAIMVVEFLLFEIQKSAARSP